MPLTTTEEPYEFLARFRNGKLVGAHVQNILVTKDGDKMISETILDAKPVGAKGFPLADILDATTQAALKTNAEQKQTIADKDTDISSLNERIAELDAKLSGVSFPVPEIALNSTLGR